MAKTGIPYCDRTWDLTIGCRKRSTGCDNCWACRTVHRLEAKGIDNYIGQVAEDGKDWLPRSNVNLLMLNLELPLHWKKPQFIFVNSKSDLFDERAPFDFIAQAFDVMGGVPRHRFMVLTKEAARMAEFITWYRARNEGHAIMWPEDFPHVILMVSVEGPEYMGRIDTLMKIPAAMRGVSIEPYIKPLDLTKGCCRDESGTWDIDYLRGHAELQGSVSMDAVVDYPDCPKLDWVVVGCEKLLGGSAGRWAYDNPWTWWNAAGDMAKACMDAGVALWMKQGPLTGGYGFGRKVASGRWDFPLECRIQQKPKGLIL